MHEIIFETLELDGFRTYTRPAKLDLNLPGLTLIRGVSDTGLTSNGAGKSTLWECLFWVLTGTTMKGLHSPDVAPWSDPSLTTKGMLTLTVNQERHTIERRARPNGLFIDGVKVSQNEVLALVPLLPDVIKNAILCGQRSDLFFDKAPREKMEIFGRVLDLSRFDRAAKLAKDKVGVHSQNITQMEIKRGYVKGDLIRIEGELKNALKSDEEWVRKQQTKKVDVTNQLADVQKRLDDAMSRMAAADIEYESATVEELALQKEVDALYDRRMSDVYKNEKPCPTCGQPVRDKALEKKIDHSIEIQRAKLREFTAKANAAKEALMMASPTVSELTAKKDFLQEEINRVEHNPYSDLIVRLRQDESRKKAEMRALVNRIEVASRLMARAATWAHGFKDVKLYLIEDVLHELEITIASMLDEFSLGGWSVTFAMEKEKKTGDVGIALQTLISSPTSKKPVKWECWSGGEGQRLRLIGALALGEVLLGSAGVSCNLRALDEPTTSLSPKGIDDLASMLRAYATMSGRSVYLIDQHSLASGNFSQVVTVEKTREGSRLIV